MRKYIFFSLFLVLSCEKEPLEEVLPMNPGMIGVQSEGDIRKSPYQNLVFVEDFVPVAGDPCYEDMKKLHCSNRLDWFMSTQNCPNDHDYSGVKGLNKCIWTVWTGWSFWVKKANFMADAVKVENGHLILRTYKNPKYNPQAPAKCGDLITPNDPDHEKARSTNCPWTGGSIDSQYVSESHKGRSALYGRIEMRAKFVPKGENQGSYLAFWMWPLNVGRGYPHVAQSEFPHLAGEIDIMEHNSVKSNPLYAFHTYHVWEHGVQGSANTGSGHIYDLTEYKIYGVEWTKDKISWYVDNSIIFSVKNGEGAKSGRPGFPLRISDRASFLMAGISITGDPAETLNDEFHVDWIKIYE